MDVNDFWQENKRFVLTVAGGVIVFFTAVLLIDNVFGSELAAGEQRKVKDNATLSGALYGPDDLERLRTENQQLAAVQATLAKAAVFVPRPLFTPDKGSLANQYFNMIAATRDELLPAAGRAGIPVPEDLGLPAIAPTKDEHIARCLEALDLIERTLRLGFDAGVGRVEGIEIRLDPDLLAGKPLKPLEKTLVTFKVRGTAGSLTRLVLLTQRSAEARVGVLEKAEFLAAGPRGDDARLELTLAALRVHESKPQEKAKP